MLGRLDHLLQTLIDSDFRSELPEDVSLANSYIVESSTTSSTDGETDRHELQRDKPLQLIDSIISRLYRFTSFFHTAIEDNTRTNVPRERRSVGDERKEELFADRVRSHISQQCPELYATVLQDRLVEQSIDRRSELTLSERDSERKGSQISLQFTSEPRNEEIERWETLSINFPPMPVQEANQPNPSCPYCLRDISNLLNARTEMQIPLWRQHLLEDARPYVCLFPECVDVALRFTHVDTWTSHMALQHSARYYCQFLGHEGFHFLTPGDLARHLIQMHATSIPPGQAPYVATKGKRWESDSIKGLILEWNKDSFEKENFIVCGLCGVRRFGFFELPTELHEVEQCNIDQLQQGKNEIPRNLRLHILDHISHHLEELALLSFPVTDRSGKGKNTDPLTSNVLSASPNNASNPVFNQTPCDWLTTLNPDKCYRWRYDAEGNIQYQWGTTQSSYGPRESKPSEDQSMGSKYQDPANSMYQSSSWGSHLKSQYSTEPSNRPSSLSSYSQSLYSGKLSQLYSSSNADTQHHSAPQNQPDLIGHSSRIAQPTLGGDKGIRPLKPSIGGIEHEKLHLSFKRVSPKDQSNFFVRGRVFKMLWTAPEGQSFETTRGSTHYSVVRFHEGPYSEIRRFVVIQNKGTFSQCIPIQTYRGYGATKPGLIISHHAVIYSGSKPPPLLAGEEGICKQALRVETSKGESLDMASRINFGKPYAVEHNVKLAEIGMISQDAVHLLADYFMDAMGLN